MTKKRMIQKSVDVGFEVQNITNDASTGGKTIYRYVSRKLTTERVTREKLLQS